MSALTQEQQQQVNRGQCPHCGCAVMVRGGSGFWPKLCTICLREYSQGPAQIGIEVLHEVCPPERLRRVYGMVATADSQEEFP